MSLATSYEIENNPSFIAAVDPACKTKTPRELSPPILCGGLRPFCLSVSEGEIRLMPFDLSNKLVIAVASSALFDLSESDAVFRNQDLAAYRAFQRSNERKVLQPGVAFPLVRRLLHLSSGPPLSDSIEVILLSRNDCDTGLRVFHSIEQHGLRISRAAFVDGRDPWRYCAAFKASLFLSANDNDVKSALASGAPAGLVLPTTYEDTDADEELRLAFDFDGVIGDNSGEAVYSNEGLAAFHASQKAQATIPMPAGPLHPFFRHISELQQKEQTYQRENRSYQPRIRSAIVTARDAPSHERVVTTLRHWGVNADEVFFLGGISKLPILQELQPHMFFDDQLLHLRMASPAIPCVHVPVDHGHKFTNGDVPGTSVTIPVGIIEDEEGE